MMPPCPSPANDASQSSAALGLELLRGIHGENAAISPWSIQAALAMVFAGAGGTTKAQMETALGFGAGTVAEVAATGKAVAESAGGEVVLEIANRLFGQEGYPFLDGYLSELAGVLGAPLETLDFEGNPRRATQQINAWVEDRTSGRIRDLIPPGALNRDTRLVAANAVYFRAPWQEPFPPAATAEGEFRLADASVVRVPMIRQSSRMGHLEGEAFTAVSLPYAGGAFEFVVVVPRGGVEELVKTLDAATLLGLAALPMRQVDLTLPKFRIEPGLLKLAPPLSALGMPSAFDDPRGSADFSAMAVRRPNDYLFLSEVFHETFVAVDEKGTEAAAATAAVMMRATAMPEEPVVVTVDRPFLFAIFHRASRACLFLGRVGRPTQ